MSGERTGGYPLQRPGFLHVRVAGTPHQMGLQHGEQLRDEIQDLLAAVRHHVLQGQPGVTGWGIRRGASLAARAMATQVPRRYREEIAGIARAANASFGDLLLLNCFDDVLANLRMAAAMFGRLGCSAFAVMGERTQDGELICGRNLDYFVMSAYGDDVWAATTYMKEHVAVVEYAPSDRARFLSVGWPGFAGVATGLSAYGITASALVVQTTRNRPVATPSCFVYRRIMEEALTLEHGVDLVRHSRRTQGHNLLLGSGDEGTAAVVEYTPWRMAVRRPQDGWLATTNHFNHPALVRHHAQLAFQSTTERHSRLSELCRACDPGSSQAGWPGEFLLDRELRSPEANEYCTVWNPCTIYSTYVEPRRRRMWLRVSDQADREFEPLDIG
jgi:hypothetical protein